MFMHASLHKLFWGGALELQTVGFQWSSAASSAVSVDRSWFLWDMARICKFERRAIGLPSTLDRNLAPVIFVFLCFPDSFVSATVLAKLMVIRLPFFEADGAGTWCQTAGCMWTFSAPKENLGRVSWVSLPQTWILLKKGMVLCIAPDTMFDVYVCDVWWDFSQHRQEYFPDGQLRCVADLWCDPKAVGYEPNKRQGYPRQK